MRKSRFVIATTATALLCGGIQVAQAQAAAQQESSPLAAIQARRGQLNEKDHHFLEKAFRGGLEEMRLGDLAKQKASSQAVREFGERMAKHHNAANEELKQIASRKGAAMPSRMSRSETFTFEHLQNKSGAEFDKAYVSDMVKDHNRDVKEFETAAREVADPDLKTWTQKTLAVLVQHQKMAQDLEASLKTQK